MTRPFPAGYVSSASIMIRREVVDRVGHLDNRLSYHVDADYCKRIWDAGWEVYYLPEATVIHLDHRGGTMVTPARRLRSVVEFHRGSYIYFVKHQMTSPWHPMHFVAAFVLGVRFVVSLGWQLVKEVTGLRLRPSLP
jgi:GT2 family glycosyltransferase